MKQLRLPAVFCWCKEEGCDERIDLETPGGWSKDKYRRFGEQTLTCRKGHTHTYTRNDCCYLSEDSIIVTSKLEP